MNDDLKAKLLADLEKTGFASEMRVVQAFLRAGWLHPGPASYLDLDTNISREIDVIAHKTIWEPAAAGIPRIQCFFQFSAEVKKASAPWVVIRSRENDHWELTDAWQNLITHDNLPGKPSDYSEALSTQSLAVTLGRRGHGIHESFKKPDESSRWYSAFIAACKAGEHSLAANTEEGSEEIYLYFVKPIVVVDATLVSATLAGDEIVLEDIAFANLEFIFRTANYTRGRYSVDVVSLSALDEYLLLCDRRLKEIFAALKRRAVAPVQ